MKENQVHIWVTDLTLQKHTFLHKRLSPSEQSRAKHFRFQRDREVYEKSRGILRFLLGKYFNAPPEKIEILTTALGKPYVAELPNGQALSFNLSHSGGLAVYAFCLKHPIGVDVEVIHPIPDLDQLAARFFTAHENKSLQSIEPQARLKTFFHYWTRKEAYLKAIGLGLSVSPEAVDVALLPIPALQLTPFQSQIKSDQNLWSLMDFFPTNESLAAVVVDASVTQTLVRHWGTDDDV